MKKPDIIEFDDFLFSGEKLLINELSKIEENKKEFDIKLSSEKNYFISIKDINNQNKYISAQYTKLMHKKSTEIDLNNNDNRKYIFDFEIKDYSNEDISVPLNNEQINNCFSNPSSDKFIGILNDNQKYLVKVDFFKNLLKNCKLLDKKNKIEIEYPSKEVKEFSLNEINIDEQDEIKIIEGKINIINENNKINNIKEEIKYEVNNIEGNGKNINELLNENDIISNIKEDIKDEMNINKGNENNIDELLINEINKINNKEEIKDEENNNPNENNREEELLIKENNTINNNKEEIKEVVKNNEGNKKNLNNIKEEIKDEINLKNTNELLRNENDKIKYNNEGKKDEMNNKEGNEKNKNEILINENDEINNINEERKDELNNNEVNKKKVNKLLINEKNTMNNIKDEIKEKFKYDKGNVKKINELFIKIKNEQGGQKSRNLKKNKSNTILLGNHFSERKNIEFLNNETCDSNNSASKINRSSFLLNSFNIMPEKDLYSIQNVVKIKKRDKKKKDNIDKNNKK